MVYAIIDAASDVEELITVAYAEKPCGLAKWFSDEVRDTAEMYLSQDQDFDEIEKVLSSLEILHDEDGSEISDIDGITVEAGGISVSVIGAYYMYEEMKKALTDFLSGKPKFKKVAVPDNPYEDEKIIDKLNAALIRSGI